MRIKVSLLLLVLSAFAWAAMRSAGAAAPVSTPYRPTLEQGFTNVPLDFRLRIYWRVFGPAWTEAEIDRQLTLIKDAGLGGVTVYFLYPVVLDDPERGIINQRFGSREFLKTFGYAARQAQLLGLRFSVNGGTGWPFGGPSVAPADSARRLRQARVSKGAAPGEAVRPLPNEKLVAAFLDGRDVTAAARAGSLPSPLSGDLRAYFDAPTGQEVKRASYGGEGFVLNHYDRNALERWLAANARPLVGAGGRAIESFGCDSLEVYRSNWTDDLMPEFMRRRGYDLRPRLPELFDDGAAARPALRFDFWRTLAELAEERFIRPLAAWCERHRLKLEMEPYGTPPSPMTAGRSIAVPTGEHYEWKGFAVQRYAASMARIAGRDAVGSEAWTWAGLPNRLGDSLSDIKLVSDMAFLCGANDLTGVDFPYSPVAAGSPGWLPYYGPAFGPGNPQWKFFPALSAYLNRCQWMLRQGVPVRPVAVYLPVEDAFAEGPVDQMLLDFAVRDRLATGHPTSEFGLANALRHHSDLIDGLTAAGFGIDGIDFWALTRLGSIRGKRLAVGAAEFEAVILPNLERMEAEALARVAVFCKAGGTVVATRRLPSGAPGLAAERGGSRWKQLLVDIFGEMPRPGRPHACGLGRGILVEADGQAGPALASFAAPSVRFSPRPPTVGFTHRRTADRDVYFFVNVGPGEARFAAEFPGPARRLEIWNAMDGEIRLEAPAASRITLQLPPRGSMFVVAGPANPSARPADAPARFSQADIRLVEPEWTLRFEGPDAPPPVRSKDLVSWTEIPGGQFFSGMGIYHGRFLWEGVLPPRALLQFDEIHEAAEVRLNGRTLGVLFTPPSEIDAASALRPGWNDLEIKVANLPLNRFLGLPDADLGPLRARFGNRFPAPEEKKIVPTPRPSGLIGGVRLAVYAAKSE